jgi:hypothetical protein
MSRIHRNVAAQNGAQLLSCGYCVDKGIDVRPARRGDLHDKRQHRRSTAENPKRSQASLEWNVLSTSRRVRMQQSALRPQLKGSSCYGIATVRLNLFYDLLLQVVDAVSS